MSQKNDWTSGPWKWEERHLNGKLIATLLVTEHRPVPCNDPVIFALREDWMGPLGPEREAAKQMVLASPVMLDALRKAEAVFAQLQERPEQAHDIIRQGYFGHALVRCRSAIAAAATHSQCAAAPTNAPVFTLPGAWEEVDTDLYVRAYQDGTAFIEARANGTTLRAQAKVNGMLGGIMHACQQIGEIEVSQSNQEAINVAIGSLEALIAAHSAAR
jgi:hypothetical protein